MKYAQTTAIELSENIKEIGKNACLAMCYLYCAGIDPQNEIEYLRLVNSAIKEHILEKDCTVKDADLFLKWITGRKTTVIKKTVASIKNIVEPTPVRYVAKGYGGHWVVVENEKIAFNSLANSVNVTKGEPVEARIIKWGFKV